MSPTLQSGILAAGCLGILWTRRLSLVVTMFLLCCATVDCRFGEEHVALSADGSRMRVIGTATPVATSPALVLLVKNDTGWSVVPQIPPVTDVAETTPECYRLFDGTVQCTTFSPNPSLVFRQLETAATTSCGLLTSQIVSCWTSGRTTADLPNLDNVPFRLLGSFAVTGFDAFHDVYCGLEVTRPVVDCWSDASVTLIPKQISVPNGIVQMVASGILVEGNNIIVTWYGVTADGQLWGANRTASATPHWPISFGRFIHVTASYALTAGGDVLPLSADPLVPPVFVFPFAVDRIASVDSLVVAVRTSDGQVVTNMPAPLNATGFFVRAPREIQVDPIHGNDSLCGATVAITTPCQSLSFALSLVIWGPVTVSLSPQRHTVCNANVPVNALTISGDCGSSDDCRAVVDCVGCDSCLTAAEHTDSLTLTRLNFTGSTSVGVEYMSSLTMTNVSFSNHSRSAVHKAAFPHATSATFLQGDVSCSGCAFVQNRRRPNANVPVLFFHAGGDLLFSDSTFLDNDLSINDQDGLLHYDALGGQNVISGPRNFALVRATVAGNVLSQDVELFRVIRPSSVTLCDVGISNNSARSIFWFSDGQDDTGPTACQHTVHNVTAVGNTAFAGVLLWMYNSSPLTVMCNRSLFASNTGSSLFLFAFEATDISISDSVFVNNYSPTHGGAVDIEGGMPFANFSMSNVTFDSNRALEMGGAVTVLLSQNVNTFHANWANIVFRNHSVTNSAGGAVSISVSSLVFNAHALTVASNTAHANGGAFNFVARDFSTISIVNSSFDRNFGGWQGGALSVLGERTTVSFTVCNFTRNAAARGGAFDLNVRFFQVLLCNVSNNTATGSGGGASLWPDDVRSSGTIEQTGFFHNVASDGGAISVVRGSAEINVCECSGNTARLTGGCLSATQSARIGIRSTRFADNAVTGVAASPNMLGLLGCGGAIAAITGQCVISDSRFVNNSAASDMGGCISVASGGISVLSSTFEQCNAKYGGAIGVVLQSELVSRDCIFRSNTAAADGGAMYASAFAKSIMNNCSFAGNLAVGSGGALALSDPFEDATALIWILSMRDNVALQNGGAMYVSTANIAINISRSLFQNNSAPLGGGGGLYWTRSEPAVDSLLFANNSALYGDSEATAVCNLTVQNAEVYRNASHYNGRDFVLSPSVRVALSDCLQQSVTAQLGPYAFMSAHVSAQDAAVLQGQTSVPIVRGVAEFPDLSFSQASGTVHITFSSDAVGGLATAPLTLTVLPCPAGTFFAPAGECIACAGGSYSQGGGVSACTLCSPGFFAASERAVGCEACPVGTYSSNNGSVGCVSCASSNGYTLRNASRQCRDCTTGLVCRGGVAQIDEGYWGYAVDNGDAVSTVKCLAGFCGGGSPIHGDCAPHRNPSSPLCGQCQPGYVEFISDSACVSCASDNTGMIVLMLALTWLCVLLIMYLSSGRNEQLAEFKVLFFFLSSARIILGPSSSWTQWLSVFESGAGINLNACVLSLSPYDLSLVEILFPVVALAELGFSVAVVKIASHWGLIQTSWYSRTRFIRTAMALLTFSFSSVSVIVFEFLQCIPAGTTSVVLLRPAMDCESDAYKHRLPIVYSIFIGWIVGVPIALSLFLRRLKSKGLLQMEDTLRRWGFVYATYDARFYWFEPFMLFRRVLISCLAVLLLRSPQLRSAALALALMGFLIVQLSLSPYAHRVPNLCDVIALFSLNVLTMLTSGHSILDSAQYSVSVQVLSALIVFALGLGLLLRILQLRLRHYEFVASLSDRLSDAWSKCHGLCCRAETSAASAFDSVVHNGRENDWGVMTELSDRSDGPNPNELAASPLLKRQSIAPELSSFDAPLLSDMDRQRTIS